MHTGVQVYRKVHIICNFFPQIIIECTEYRFTRVHSCRYFFFRDNHDGCYKTNIGKYFGIDLKIKNNIHFLIGEGRFI